MPSVLIYHNKGELCFIITFNYNFDLTNNINFIILSTMVTKIDSLLKL